MIKILDKIVNWIRMFFIDGEVYYINGSETLPPPLEKDEEDNWLLSVGPRVFCSLRLQEAERGWRVRRGVAPLQSTSLLERL